MTPDRSILRPFRLAAALLGAVSLALTVGGCNGNSTSASPTTRPPVGIPPTVTAYFAPENVRTADPLGPGAWRSAAWTTLTAPANTLRTTATSRAAVLFDATTLYVAFINHRQPPAAVSLKDGVSLYLDTRTGADGREMIKVSVDATGEPSCTWVRMSAPPAVRPDGSPDLGHPVSTIPDVTIPGLTARVGEGSFDGSPVWTAVVAIPLKTLPLPLRTSATPGAHWKFNLMRSVVTDWGTPRAEQLQANLSPVYVGAQEFAPNRLAELVLVR